MRKSLSIYFVIGIPSPPWDTADMVTVFWIQRGLTLQLSEECTHLVMLDGMIKLDDVYRNEHKQRFISHMNAFNVSIFPHIPISLTHMFSYVRENAFKYELISPYEYENECRGMSSLRRRRLLVPRDLPQLPTEPHVRRIGKKKSSLNAIWYTANGNYWSTIITWDIARNFFVANRNLLVGRYFRKQ